MIDEITQIGMIVSQMLQEGALNGKISIYDEEFQRFLPWIMAEGNLEFMKTIAKRHYHDTRREVVEEFLDTLIEWTNESIKKYYLGD